MNTISNTVLNAAEAARYVGLSASTLAKLRLNGGGPSYIKLGRRVVYRHTELDAWLNERIHTSTSEYSQ